MGAPKPQPIKPAAPPPLPTVADPEVEKQAQRRRLLEEKSGTRSTILTGNSGVQENPNSKRKKTLLGGG